MYRKQPDSLPLSQSLQATPVAIVAILLLTTQTVVRGDEPVSFNQQIRPILSENCFFCHGPDPDNREADLRLDDRQSALDFLAIVPGKPEESELIARLEQTDRDLLMPPPHSNRTVSPEQIELLKHWIAQGAPYDEHWSFKPLAEVSPPEIRNAQNQPYGPIDAFVVQKLQQAKLSLSPPASREAIARRVCFDLTGLPPTLAQLDEFLHDDTPDAYEKLVDRLLATDACAERLTSEWLDVARYSDSYGYQVDRDRYVWPWRDWVLRAFQKNMPYNQFITEQLAGDLLPNATDDQILATTFNRLHPQKVEGGSVPEEFRIEYIADRTQTFGTAFLGLTLECARCHTHKYDPISHHEYYQFTAFFDRIDESGLYSFFTDSIPTPTLLLASDEQKQQLAALRTQVEIAEAELEKVAENQTAAFSAWLTAGCPLHAQNTVAGPGSASPFDVALESAAAEPAPPGDSTPAPADVSHPFIPGRIAHLTFEDKAGIGGNQLVPGVSGQAVQLTGDDAVDLKVGNFRRSEPFSVSLWINVPEAYERAVIYHRSRAWTDAASRGYELLIEDGRLSAALVHYWPGNALRIQAIDPLPLQQWLHVAVTYDGSSRANGLKIYVNGESQNCEVIRDQLTKNITGGGGDHITIGERFRDRGFRNGKMDEFQVFDRELTPLEIAHLHQEPTTSQTALTTALQSTPADLEFAARSALRKFYESNFNAEIKTAREQLETARHQLHDTIDPIQEIMVMREAPVEIRSHLLLRGVYDAKGDEVSPATLTSLHPFPADAPRNRLGLAQWITDPSNPLTPRVTVNRYWQMLLGEGLVRTPDDFGSQGTPPTHPELLDWLARDFLNQGWDVKRLLRQIVLSQTYRQSSTVTAEHLARDPENRLLTRFPARRLPAEMVRDTALQVSGLLVPKFGGAPVRPYEIEASFKPSPRSKGEGLYRRSLYTYWKRNAPAPVMLALDASLRDVCRVKRDKTMSPLQAFVLLNGPQFVEASRVAAQKFLAPAADSAAPPLTDIFRSLTARYPTDEERAILQNLYDRELEHFTAYPEHATDLLTVGDQPASAEIPTAQLAALTLVVNTLLNYDETQMQR